MKLAAGIMLSSLLGLTGLRADLNPAAWHSSALGTAAANNNEWYHFPDSSGNPRILVKATGGTAGANAARKFLTGGPPTWVESASANIGLSRQGVFVPTSTGGGYLVAPHASKLQMAIFGSAGTAVVEVIDGNTGTYSGISAELDSNNVLHVGYVWNGTWICYARRTGGASNPWVFKGQDLGAGTTIHDTAVVPIPTTSGGQDYDSYLYFTATASGVRTLWQTKPGVVANTLYILWAANPRINIENFVGLTLRGSRAGNVGRVYYFGSGNTNSWKFKRFQAGGASTDLETAGNVSPGSIRVAFGPDGKQRAAWFNETTKSIHYLKPNAVDVPVLAGTPVVLTGNPTDPDLLGLHFGPDGMPYLLYRRDLNEGFVAFPNDNFDFNGNGRLDILDSAFNSTTAGLEMLPVAAATAGVTNSANRFKFRFPTVGSATTNAFSAVVSSQSSYRNFQYSFQLSQDGINWTPVTTGGAIAYTPTQQTGTSPQQLTTMVGVVAGTAPGALPKRFARMVVTRPAYGY